MANFSLVFNLKSLGYVSLAALCILWRFYVKCAVSDVNLR